MKKLHITTGTVLFFLIAASCANNAEAQNSRKERQAAKEVAVQNMVNAQDYVFKAQMVLPVGGRTRQLTSDYDMQVSRDSVAAYLPYFGRAYTPPANLTGGGIQFKSRNFDYTVTAGKRGGWNILIRPKDVKDIQQLSLSITTSGYASLQVISNSRQPISFNGYITETGPKKAD